MLKSYGKIAVVEKMCSSSTYDVCVIGAGVVGSSTAHYLASRGQNTLLLEQFPLPHWRGSSHGQTRIIRGSYEESYYTKMVVEAQKMWKKVEEKAQQQILVPNVGMLTVEKGPGKGLDQIVSSLVKAGENFQVLSNKKLKEKFPELSFSPHYSAVLETSAGVLKADKCLRVLQEQFLEFGGTLKDGETVAEVWPGETVTIKTNNNLFTAKKVIITAGPWTNKLLKPLGITLPLRPQLAVVVYWKTKEPSKYSLKSGFPNFYDCSASDGRKLYGIPSSEYPNMFKFGCTGLCTIPDLCKEIDPDARDNDRALVEMHIQRIRGYVQDHLPHLDYRQPAIVETCIYTLTPDGNYVLDKHPKFSNVVVGAGFSAHGFKLGPVSGKILAQLAMGETPAYDLSPFRISRFKTSIGQKASL
ncbi:peroxisomal sarcosine oxidase-like [Porites lutea]|uniref:peroxisomal sarcosine oxidase-like n=1 Tax=Porites lutea TaxID=51062 RepID=UPI003CC579A2